MLVLRRRGSECCQVCSHKRREIRVVFTSWVLKRYRSKKNDNCESSGGEGTEKDDKGPAVASRADGWETKGGTTTGALIVIKGLIEI